MKVVVFVFQNYLIYVQNSLTISLYKQSILYQIIEREDTKMFVTK